MSEKLQPISNKNWCTPLSLILWEIMVRESGGSKDGMVEKFGNLFPDAVGDEQGEVTVDVDLRINGVPVSFKKSCEEILSRWEKQFDDEVLKKAKELISSSRLQRLTDIIERVEWQLEQEVESLYNEKKSV